MVNQEWLNKRYYEDEKGNLDPVCHALNCFEQLEYHVLKNYTYNYWKAFCNTVTIAYVERKDRHIICSDEIKIENNLFKVNIYKDNKPYFQKIKEKLDLGLLVGFETMFDLLLPYIWYDENCAGEHNGHIGIIASYDDKYYYVLDSPNVLIKERVMTYRENSEIILVPHEMLHKVFDRLCVLMTVQVREEAIGYPVDSMDMLRKIIDRYYRDEISENEEEIIYKGRVAYKRIYENLVSDNYKYLMEDFFKDHWYLHLIMSKHIILLNTLLSDKNFNSYKNSKRVLEQLSLCIEAWDNLKQLVLKNCVKPIKDLREHLKEILLKTISLENDFFQMARELG